jgi:signal transduction histidine kinase
VAFAGLFTVFAAASAYFVVIISVMVMTAPVEVLPYLLVQKLGYLAVLIGLTLGIKSGRFPVRSYDKLFTCLLILCLSSPLFSAAAGITSRFGTYGSILILICAMMAVSFRQALWDWALIWGAWLWVSHSLPEPIFVDEITKLVGIQLLAVPALHIRLGLYHRQFGLIRELADSLQQSEQIRADLDRAVAGRTEQLQMAYEELRLSTQERESMAQEREKLQEQLQQSQKMESLGRLAGGVAHDFNNLLTVIMGNLELAERTSPEEEDWKELVQEATVAARRAAEVTSQLLAFSRKQVMNVKQLKVQQVVQDSLRMVQRLLGEDIQLDVNLTCPGAVVEGDTSRLQQVLLNLVINARDAMPAGGRLSITLREIGGDVELQVSDSGCGIDPALHGRIFEPFFTNKPFGEGTGLGLATVDGIVSMHSGRIEVDSQPGQGATFRVYLPCYNVHLRESSSSRRISPAVPGLGSILLVEDDDQVRNLALRVLRLSGYQVKAVESGEKALQCMAVDASFDLLVTDVVMPGIDGGKLAEAVREKKSDLPVLFMSGYTDDRLSAFGISRGECDFLAKPFTPAQLHRSVSEILERSKVVN